MHQVAALLSRYLEYIGGEKDDGNANIIRDSLQVIIRRMPPLRSWNILGYLLEFFVSPWIRKLDLPLKNPDRDNV